MQKFNLLDGPGAAEELRSETQVILTVPIPWGLGWGAKDVRSLGNYVGCE